MNNSRIKKLVLTYRQEDRKRNYRFVRHINNKERKTTVEIVTCNFEFTRIVIRYTL